MTLADALRVVGDLPVDHAVIEALARAHTALVELSVQVHYSPRDSTGEDATRRVQAIANRGLRGQLEGVR